MTINNHSTMEELIANNFVTNYYDTLIPNYDIYVETIRDYQNSVKGDIMIPYFDLGIMEDELVKKLESFMALDIYNSDEEIKKSFNPYVYAFDSNLISRYKVLRNLSILRNKYGYLNDDMVLTSVVYNSYLSEEAFNLIKESIRKDEIIK